MTGAICRWSGTASVESAGKSRSGIDRTRTEAARDRRVSPSDTSSNNNRSGLVMDVAKDVAKSAASRLRQYHRVYPKNPESCRLHRPPDHRRAMRGRATARAEIACEDAFFAHTAIIGAIDVGQWHADRRKEDIWPAFCSPAGWRNHIF